MSKKYRRKKFIFRFTTGQKLVTIFFLCFCIIFQVFFTLNLLTNRHKKEVNAATVYGQSVATGILLTLDDCVNVTQQIKNLQIEFETSFSYYFDRICQHFMDDNPTISSIYLAPKAVISCSYPPEVARYTNGFRMLEDPVQGPRAQLAIDTRQTTIAGPLYLIEGGTGFIIRNPYFKDNEFQFFSIVILDWDSFKEQVLQTVNHEKSGYHIAVWKTDNRGIVTDEYGFIMNDSSRDISRLVDIEISIPNDVWHLSVEPVNGWSGFREILPEFFLSLFINIAVFGLIILRQIESSHKMYEYEHDSLTGLYTRSAFYRRVNKLIKENPDEDFDIIVSDIENFKVLNSIYGTKKCDDLLCYLAKEYKYLNTNAIIARYGGDLFVNIFKSSQNIGSALFQKNVTEIANKAPIPNLIVKYGFYGKIDKTLPPNLLCDRALLAAKSILHNYDKTIANYEGPISHRHLREQMLEASFANAIANKDFKVWYQPKFDAKTEKLVGAEALVRWEGSNGNIVSPADFIYVFENDGLIVRLDEYVFRNVCESLKSLIDQGIKVVPVSVNLSRSSLHHVGIIRKYKEVVDEVGIPIELVPLEITESTAFTNKQIKNLASSLKEMGFKLDMDDFGTGSSSLASLNIIPFDVIKLDKSLIDFIGTPDGDELVRNSIELAHFKKITVIAEGVEKDEQLEFLRKHNCDIIQGYYYSPPVPFDKAVEGIKELMKQDRI